MKLSRKSREEHWQKVAISRRRLEYFTFLQQEKLKMHLGNEFDVELLANLEEFLSSITKPTFQVQAVSAQEGTIVAESFAEAAKNEIK